MDSFLKIEELHHIGIAVKDFDEILIFFSLLGYEKTSSTSVRDELQKVDLIFLTHKKNHPSIELVKPYTADSPVNGYLKNNNTAQVNLLKPEDGISPGQACVFYSKDQFGYKVLGGGWIYN